MSGLRAKSRFGRSATTGYNRPIMDVLVPVAAAAGYAPDSLVCGGDLAAGRPSPLMMYRSFADLGVWPAARVVKVDDTSAQVLLAIDSTHTVGVELEGSHATGVAYGMWQQGGRMEIRYVDRNVEVKPEEKVVTTCAPDIRTANMPCGLIIGKASGQPSIDSQGDTQTVQVIPAADFEDLAFVTVITSQGTGQ